MISKKNFSILKICISIVIFYLAIKYENVNNQRLIILATTFSSYIIIGLVRNLYINSKKIYVLSFIIDIILIFYLESNSKYILNYFLHLFYIIILIEGLITLKKKQDIFISFIVFIVSIIKYMRLIYFKNNLGSISQMIFFVLVNILIIIGISFAKYYKEEKEKKDELYKNLLDTHRSLKQHANLVEKYSKVEERNRIAREIHDTLGHDMTALIMQLEMVSHTIDNDIESAKQILNEGKISARESLSKIRKIVEALKPEDEINDIGQAIEEMILSFSHKTGRTIKLDIDGEKIITSPTININLYRIVQESLTNGVKHSKSKEISIYIRYESDNIKFQIKNDTEASADIIIEGNGIKGMRERVKSLNGELFINNESNKFKIKGYIPFKRGEG